jgi:hypothetical protein
MDCSNYLASSQPLQKWELLGKNSMTSLVLTVSDLFCTISYYPNQAACFAAMNRPAASCSQSNQSMYICRAKGSHFQTNENGHERVTKLLWASRESTYLLCTLKLLIYSGFGFEKIALSSRMSFWSPLILVIAVPVWCSVYRGASSHLGMTLLMFHEIAVISFLPL